MVADNKYTPKISVIIPIYNGEKDLPDLLKCLQQQTYPKSQIEYLLVNNNSRDNTQTILIESCQLAQQAGFNFIPLLEDKIQSSYAARNLGIKQAKSDILVFTDADCRPQPDWLKFIIQPFKHQAIGIVVGEVEALPGKTILEKYAERNHLMSQKFLVEHSFCPYGQTANIAIRKQAFSAVGLFRPYLTTGGDADICWRIQKGSDWQLYYEPEAVILHRHRSNLKNFISQWRRYGESNRYLHELHGVNLMRELTLQYSFYRLARWLIKEIPRDAWRTMKGEGKLIDLLTTPIDLIGYQARTRGQKESKLPEIARQIEPF